MSDSTHWGDSPRGYVSEQTGDVGWLGLFEARVELADCQEIAGPRGVSPSVAIEWARLQAPTVVVYLDGRAYSAGRVASGDPEWEPPSGVIEERPIEIRADQIGLTRWKVLVVCKRKSADELAAGYERQAGVESARG